MTINSGLTLEQLKEIHPRATLDLILRLKDAVNMNCYDRENLSFIDDCLVISSYSVAYWYRSKQIPNTKYICLTIKSPNGSYTDSPVSFYLPEGNLVVSTFRPGFWFYYLKQIVEKTELLTYDYHVDDRDIFQKKIKLEQIEIQIPEIETPMLILDPNEII